jgi:hypothetical protein
LSLLHCSTVLAFKAVRPGNAGSSANSAKSLPSGSYTFYPEDGAGIGDQNTSGPTTSGQACLDACDGDADCAGVVIVGALSDLSAALTANDKACKLIKGKTDYGTGMRTVTKTDITMLQMPASLSGMCVGL